MPDFTRAKLGGSQFTDVDLSGAVFHDVDLSRSTFRAVAFHDVVMRGVELGRGHWSTDGQVVGIGSHPPAGEGEDLLGEGVQGGPVAVHVRHRLSR